MMRSIQRHPNKVVDKHETEMEQKVIVNKILGAKSRLDSTNSFFIQKMEERKRKGEKKTKGKGFGKTVTGKENLGLGFRNSLAPQMKPMNSKTNFMQDESASTILNIEEKLKKEISGWYISDLEISCTGSQQNSEAQTPPEPLTEKPSNFAIAAQDLISFGHELEQEALSNSSLNWQRECPIQKKISCI